MNSYRGYKRGTKNKKQKHPKSRNRRKIVLRRRMIKAGFIILILLTIFIIVFLFLKNRKNYVDVDAEKPEIDVQLLDVNPYSRPGIESEGVRGVVIHYTANPGSTAQNNRDYFNGLQDSHETEASSNFVVGLDGEIIQCVPTWEIAYASNERNSDTVSIEVCHPDESGKFTKETYKSLVQLTAWLCKKFDLTEAEVIRHYDVTGKNCPKYFVENEKAWEQFKGNVRYALERSK